MATVRRWYILLVCLISLQAVAWAAITLLGNLFTGADAPVAATAFQVAVIVIGAPIFLVHWSWAQRLAAHDVEERESTLRRLYLYGVLASFLGPLAANAFSLLTTLFAMPFGEERPSYGYGYAPGDIIVHNLMAVVVLAVLWFYHYRLVRADAQAAPDTGNAAAVRRLYLFGFSAGGVTATSIALINLLRWALVLWPLYPLGGPATIVGDDLRGFTTEIARLLVGVPLWLTFWRQAQRLFVSAHEEERESALRKFYLYVIVFVAVLAAVTNAAMILAGFFRTLLKLPPLGDIRGPLPIVIGMAVLWAYHAYVLRHDAQQAAEAEKQAGIRRLYLYLVAAIGLGATLAGVGGDISVLIRLLGGTFLGEALKEQLAWFTAALIAGVPVWFLPWSRAQIAALAPTPAGASERRSIIRKIHLYFYLFVATMAVLASAVYIAYRLLSLLFGAPGEGQLLSDLGQAIAFALIGVGVWLYHGATVRGDGQTNQREQAKRLSELRVTVVDAGDGQLGRALLDNLRREWPELALTPIGLTPAAATALGGEASLLSEPAALSARLAGAQLIVGPWSMVLAAGNETSAAIARSSARKLLVPTPVEGWEWAGVDRWSSEALVRQTVHAVKQIVTGEEVKAVRPLSAGAIIGIIVGVFILLILLAIPVIYFFARGF